MITTKSLFEQVYASFNKKDADATLAFMSEDVSWPTASEGGRVVGKQAIRDYWTRQWVAFDPHLTILEVLSPADGQTEVKVHQLVKNLRGQVLSDTELSHVYTTNDGLIERMDILEADGNTDGQSAAFKGAGH